MGRKERKVALADVALKAGVSKTAASMALFGGAKAIKVSEQAQRRENGEGLQETSIF